MALGASTSIRASTQAQKRNVRQIRSTVWFSERATITQRSYRQYDNIGDFVSAFVRLASTQTPTTTTTTLGDTITIHGQHCMAVQVRCQQPGRDTWDTKLRFWVWVLRRLGAPGRVVVPVRRRADYLDVTRSWLQYSYGCNTGTNSIIHSVHSTKCQHKSGTHTHTEPVSGSEQCAHCVTQLIIVHARVWWTHSWTP